MEDLLALIIQLVFEVLSECSVDWLRWLLEVDWSSPGASVIICLVLGIVGGVLSLMARNSPILEDSAARIANLVAPPVVAGAFVESMFGKRRRARTALLPNYLMKQDQPQPRLWFWRGAMFTFGLVVTRFAFFAP